MNFGFVRFFSVTIAIDALYIYAQLSSIKNINYKFNKNKFIKLYKNKKKN